MKNIKKIRFQSNRKRKLLLNRKGQGISVNIVVTLILGIIIFSIGLGLFSKISKSGDNKVNELNKKIKTDIMDLECDGENWLCAPSYELKNGKSGTFYLFIANKDDQNKNFQIQFDNLNTNGKFVSAKCGTLGINYLKNKKFYILSGESGKIPFIAEANKIKKVPCSFVIPVKLLDDTGSVIDKTTVIMRIT